MKNKLSGNTGVAFRLLLASVIYVAGIFGLLGIYFLIIGLSQVFFVFGYLQSPVGVLWCIMLFLAPFAVTAINLCGVVFQIKALVNGESKIKNTLMMAFTVIYEIVSVWFCVDFMKGL